MNIEAEFREFAQGESRLHFIIGNSGLIMKNLDNLSATVYCWESEKSAKEFISTKFPLQQREHYSVHELTVEEFEKLKQSIKWLPENAEVNLALFGSEIATT